MPDVLTAARTAHARRDWPHALTLFTAAGEQTELTADDLDALADAQWWLGMAAEALATCEAAYHGYVHENRPRKAAMSAMQIAYLHFLRGEGALGSGWLGTASRLLADSPECVEHGYLTYIVDVEAALDRPELENVRARAREVAEIGRRHGDPDLVAVATAGEGRALAAASERLGIALDVRSAPPGGLSAREMEVLSLVSAGKSNREIAEILVLSPKTVSRHLSNIFTKISVSSRTEAAAYAFAHELPQASPR